MRRDVFHVSHVLVAAFNFEAAHTGIDQRRQVVALVVVFQGQDVLVMGDDASLRVTHLVGQATGLRAIAAIGAASRVRVTDEALATVCHAQRPMDEKLQGHPIRLGGGSDLGNLLQRQFTGQHHLGEPDILQKPGFLGRTDVGLGAGVQLYGGQVKFQQTHVLHNQHIRAGVVDIPGQLAGLLQLIVAQNRVQRDEHAPVIAVRVTAQPLDVL